MLATIVQLDPIYVNFNASERDVLHVRDMLYKRGQKADDSARHAPVEVGLQTDAGYPHKGKLDYIAPTVNQAHRHARGARRAAERTAPAAAGLFRARARAARERLWRCWSRRSRSERPGRALCAGRQQATNVVEQRKVEVGPTGRRDGRDRERAQGRRPRRDRRGLLRAVPGQKVDPQTQTAAKLAGA